VSEIDDYLNRVDELLSKRAATAQPQAGDQAGGAATQSASVPAPPSASSLVAEAFAKLLALEDGEPGAQPVRLVSGNDEPRVTDAFVEEVTRRVIERLSPDAVRAVVADVVSEVAERLVREEIERIRNRQR
jgi:hypothetical protein